MTKRVFLGFDVHAPWPDHFPEGRLLLQGQRHMTLAFLGNLEEEKIKNILQTMPTPSFPISPVGKFNKCLFLPDERENVIAWNIEFLNLEQDFYSFQKELAEFLLENKLIRNASFLPHVTLARKPFNKEEWQKQFTPLPCFLGSFHLYESLGDLKYEPIWSYKVLPPIEEIEHTADRAFALHGKTPRDLFIHAQVALSFIDPKFVHYMTKEDPGATVEDIVYALNRKIALVDAKEGCNLKAVSLHGEMETHSGILTWEMIVDV